MVFGNCTTILFGIFLFGETVGFYEDFWFSTYMGRFTLMDLFNASTGVVVLLIVIAALLAFADQTFVTDNQIVSHADDALAFSFSSAMGSRYAAANPNPEAFELEYESRVQLQIKRGPASGGCG